MVLGLIIAKIGAKHLLRSTVEIAAVGAIAGISIYALDQAAKKLVRK